MGSIPWALHSWKTPQRNSSFGLANISNPFPLILNTPNTLTIYTPYIRQPILMKRALGWSAFGGRDFSKRGFRKLSYAGSGLPWLGGSGLPSYRLLMIVVRVSIDLKPS